MVSWNGRVGKYYVRDDYRAEFDAYLVENFADALECYPVSYTPEPIITAYDAAIASYTASLVRAENGAKYRSIVATKNALQRAQRYAQAMRIAEHLDAHWADYATN